MNWNEVLNEHRDSRRLLEEEDLSDLTSSSQQWRSLWQSAKPHFWSIHQQLERYLACLSSSAAASSQKTSKNQISKTQLIKDTRNALRLGLSCLSIPDDEVRAEAQTHALECFWKRKSKRDNNNDDPLLLLPAILCAKTGDGTCRLLCARLLSNLVTGNAQSASVVATQLPLAPSAEAISRQLQDTFLEENDNMTKSPGIETDDNTKVTARQQQHECIMSITWVDAMLHAVQSGNRPALGALVAALYNCLLQQQRQTSSLAMSSTTTAGSSSLSFVQQVASCPLLLCTLLRQVVSVQSLAGILKKERDEHGKQHSNDIKNIKQESTESNGSGNGEDDEDDPATDWIILVLMKLVRLGGLATMYQAIASDGDGGGAPSFLVYNPSMSSPDDSRLWHVLPEQLVLLHCLRSQVEEHSSSASHKNGKQLDSEKSNTAATMNENQRAILLLGGEQAAEVDVDRGVGVVVTHLFLARLVSALLDREDQTQGGDENNNGIHDNKSNSSDNDALLLEPAERSALQQSQMLAVLDILAETLANDTKLTTRVRQAVGTQTQLIQQLCRALGRVYDTLTERNSGRKSRDVLVKSEEQTKLVVLVRVLGNLAFACQNNQDLLRTTRVPPPPGVATVASAKTINDSATLQQTMDRTGLHVLLSCTSYSHACFTLREWAVVAIRNVLDDNMANQHVVEQLQAQQPVQSAELNDMGIRVDMDSKGKVSVAPLDSEKR